jgi:glycerol-1-phosphate dehydrogenase [NAD(P)+]
MAVGPDVAGLVPELASSLAAEGKPILLVHDAAIADIIMAALPERLLGLPWLPLPLGGAGQHLDSTVELGDQAARAAAASGAGLVLGAGSGVIADLAKWIGDRAGLPVILYGTAASMNAHASITATMTRCGVKESVWLAPPRAVLMDSCLAAAAPLPMRLAGLGDLCARNVCNADWKLGRILRGRAFCPVPFELTARSQGACQALAAELRRGSPEAALAYSEACLVSAASMTMMAGDTSASSGLEHVFSHYCDLQAEMGQAPKNLHGLQVGIGVLIAFALWDYLRNVDPGSLDPDALAAARPPIETLEEENRRLFGNKAGLFNKAVQAKWIPEAEYPDYLRRVLEGWGPMWEELAPYLGERAAVEKAYAEAGFPRSLDAIQRSRDHALDILRFGWRYRSRYTALDLAWELGILPAAAEDILSGAGLA